MTKFADGINQYFGFAIIASPQLANLAVNQQDLVALPQLGSLQVNLGEDYQLDLTAHVCQFSKCHFRPIFSGYGTDLTDIAADRYWLALQLILYTLDRGSLFP